MWATHIDVLAPDHTVERRDGYLVVRSPGNPFYYWGNLLIFDCAPTSGDGARWEALFEQEFAQEPLVRHHTFCWDVVDGTRGAAETEFIPRGYKFDETVGLVSDPAQLQPHPRANRDVVIRPLDPAPGADEHLWEAVNELWLASRDPAVDSEDGYRDYSRRRLLELRELFRSGAGSWYVALWPETGDVAGSCGVVVTDRRGRFQAVDTAEAYRRRGVCSRLVLEAGRDAARRFGADRLVIVADANYHALGLYESLGFTRAERVFGVWRAPPENRPR